ncbi:MAG: hypothetical protein QGH40_04795 [bacterium]|nr:hypothetical protein [bacterium]
MRNSRFLLCMSCLFTVLVVLFSTPVRGQNSEPETTAQNAVTMFRANTLFKRGAFLEAAGLYRSVETDDAGTAFEAALGEMTSLVEEAARFKERERYEEALELFSQALELLDILRDMDTSFMPSTGSNFIFTEFFISTYLRQVAESLRFNIADSFQALGALAGENIDERVDYFNESLEFATFAQEQNAQAQITACGVLAANRLALEKELKEASRMFADLSGDANPVQQESTAIRADRLELYHEVARKLKDIKQDLENLCSSEEQDGCANEGLVKALKKFFDFLGDLFLNESDGPPAGDEGPDHPDTEIPDLKMPDSDR